MSLSCLTRTCFCNQQNRLPHAATAHYRDAGVSAAGQGCCMAGNMHYVSCNFVQSRPQHVQCKDSVLLCLLQAEGAAWQTCSMSSLLPHFLHSLQQALQSSLPELDYGPIKFCHAWSVLMFALASVDPATAQHKPVRSALPFYQQFAVLTQDVEPNTRK